MMVDVGGRPQANINWKKIDDLLIAGNSGVEIAAYFGLSPCTIYDRCLIDNGVPFSEYSRQKYAKGDLLLRSQQFAKAVGASNKGDNTMLVWLGKNRLNQVESPKELQMQEESHKQFEALMAQIKGHQSILSIADSSSKNEIISECEIDDS